MKLIKQTSLVVLFVAVVAMTNGCISVERGTSTTTRSTTTTATPVVAPASSTTTTTTAY